MDPFCTLNERYAFFYTTVLTDVLLLLIDRLTASLIGDLHQYMLNIRIDALISTFRFVDESCPVRIDREKHATHL